MLTQKARTEPGSGFGTPTVFVDGQRFTGDLYSEGPLEDAIRKARA